MVLRKTKTCLCFLSFLAIELAQAVLVYIVNAKTNGIETQEAKETVAILLTYFSQNSLVLAPEWLNYYRKISNIRHTKSQNLNDFRFILQLSLSNLLKLGVKSRMKM